MTKKELSQLYWLNREIEQDKRRLKELKEAAEHTTAQISGLPHSSGISDKTAIAAEIADVQNIIDAKLKMAVAEYNRLNRYIAGIDDSMVRQIMTLRHIKGMTWNQVAAEIGVTEGCVKMAYHRFLHG